VCGVLNYRKRDPPAAPGPWVAAARKRKFGSGGGAPRQ